MTPANRGMPNLAGRTEDVEKLHAKEEPSIIAPDEYDCARDTCLASHHRLLALLLRFVLEREESHDDCPIFRHLDGFDVKIH